MYRDVREDVRERDERGNDERDRDGRYCERVRDERDGERERV